MIPPIASVISYLLGWIYTLAWSISFYPQVILNWRRKSVSGLSIDFVSLNPIGFACYFAFTAVLFFSASVQEEYRERNDGQSSSVRLNDVAFAGHALLISSITLLQTFIYKRHPSQGISPFNRVLISTLLLSISTALLVSIFQTAWISPLDLLYFLSYIKLYISFAKYLPQAYLNWKSKSTVGWSIQNVLLDLTGGSLSLAQLFLDAWIADDWSSVVGNPGKLGLGFLSLSFDIFFIFQHYALYPSRVDVILEEAEEGATGEGRGERRPLLSP